MGHIEPISGNTDIVKQKYYMEVLQTVIWRRNLETFVSLSIFKNKKTRKVLSYYHIDSKIFV